MPPSAPPNSHAAPPPARLRLAEMQLRPDAVGTGVAVFGILITLASMGGRVPTDLAHYAALGVGISLLISLLLDLRKGILNLIRADVMALLAYYFLTLFEFLLPQAPFNLMISITSTHKALVIALLGFVGLLIGRHIPQPKKQPFQNVLTMEIPAAMLVLIFWGAFITGYFYMLLAVNFNVADMVNDFMDARFTQPWQRSKFGDWKALLNELGLFTYLIPPLAGVIFARRERFGKFALFTIFLGYLFTLFYGFSGGTRNVFATFLVTFLIAYVIARPPNAPKRGVIILCAVSAIAMYLATIYMLRFRNIGLREFVLHGSPPGDPNEKGLFIDYNLYAIGKLTEVFPERHHYLGLEVPYNAIIRPIPRAIWKGKPEGLSISIEDALGVEGLTIATSFSGEAYMSGGLIGVLAVGLFFGMYNGWWNHLSSPKNSELGILIYASGFFAAVISMRSLFEFTTALMPVAASFVLTIYVIGFVAKKTIALRHPRRNLGPRPPGSPALRN
jgi:hypothetical protein